MYWTSAMQHNHVEYIYTLKYICENEFKDSWDKKHILTWKLMQLKMVQFTFCTFCTKGKANHVVNTTELLKLTYAAFQVFPAAL